MNRTADADLAAIKYFVTEKVILQLLFKGFYQCGICRAAGTDQKDAALIDRKRMGGGCSVNLQRR